MRDKELDRGRLIAINKKEPRWTIYQKLNNLKAKYNKNKRNYKNMEHYRKNN